MSLHLVAEKQPTTKPDDLVRTPSGQTGTVIRINSDGSREIQLLGGEVVALMPSNIYLVRAAVPRPWPSRAPEKYDPRGT